MNTTSKPNKFGIAYLRGSRDYVRAIDALTDSPITLSDKSYRVRFHDFGEVPVHWMPAQEHQEEGHALAELTVRNAAGATSWVLVPDPEVSEFQLLPDITFQLPPPLLSNDQEFRIMLLPELSFWEQVVEAVKIWAKIERPNLRGSVAGASGDASCFQPLEKDGQLRLVLGPERMGLTSISYSYHGKFKGKILIAAYSTD